MTQTKNPNSTQKKESWHALSIDEVLEKLKTNRDGLHETEAFSRQKKYGANEFTEAPSDSLLVRLVRQFRSPLTIVLLIAFLITLVLREYIDASVILFAVLIAVAVGVFQENKASRAFEKLRKSQTHTATVIRAGKKHEISAGSLVPGDIVSIHSGMQVPADIRIFESKNLSINEASLTGEWLSVTKHPDTVSVGTPFAQQENMAWMNTFVADGYGRGVVVATGDQTVMGELAYDLNTIIDEKTPLQVEMEHISRVMLWIVLGAVLLIFVAGITHGESVEFMLLTAIAIAVASIPEGLPAAVTIVLAVGMEALLKRGGLVRNLLAAETLGSTTYVLTDKTGTLTEARMAITDVVYLGCVGDVEKQCSWQTDPSVKDVFNVALCASDAYLDEGKDGNEESYTVKGEPMERAILEAALRVGITLEGDSARAQRVDYLEFTSDNRHAAGLTRAYGTRLCLNGAPELLLSNATYLEKQGTKQEMSAADRDFFENQIAEKTRKGKRIIAIAYKDIGTETIPTDSEERLNENTFMGILVIDDPIRANVHTAIDGVKRAGAQIRLVTGDNPATGLSVAQQVGIAGKNDHALTGEYIAELSDADLLKAIHTTKVFARVLPRQKMRLAHVLQRSGEIVAMTGDGVNDAPALRKANIGVALGSGTEVAKESSDLVLVDDTFNTIYAAIEEGRRIIANLRKIIGYLISTSLSEAILIAGALVTGGIVPILPAQILWANIIEEGLMSVAFAFEPGDKNAMKKHPTDIHEEGVLSKRMIRFIGIVVIVLSIFLLSLYAYLRHIGVPDTELRSVMFLAISLDSLFIAFSFRSLTTPFWQVSLHTNLFFVGSFLLSLTLFTIVLSVPFLQKVFSYQPLPFFDLALIFLYGVSSMVVIEVGKWIFFEREKRI